MTRRARIGTIALLCLSAASGCGGSDSSRNVVIGQVQFGTPRQVAGRTEVDVAWPNFEATLRGTIYLPLGHGPFPAVMLHFGSNRWSRPIISINLITVWLDQGIAVLAYDKRGVGESGGACCPVSDPSYFPLLASDLTSGIAALQMYPDIDPNRIGLYGFSQGGWVVPEAAARSPSVAFTVIGSGPAVSLGEEELYSSLVGENDCKPTGISLEEIAAQLAAAGPSRFDPRSDLEMYTIPGYWFYGGIDLSVPVPQSVNVLEDIRTTFGKDFTIQLYPNANHSMIIGGGICQNTGPSINYFPAIFAWLSPILFGP